MLLEVFTEVSRVETAYIYTEAYEGYLKKSLAESLAYKILGEFYGEIEGQHNLYKDAMRYSLSLHVFTREQLEEFVHRRIIQHGKLK